MEASVIAAFLLPERPAPLPAHSSGSTRTKCVSRAFPETGRLAHAGVEDDDAGLRIGQRAGGVEGRDDGIEVVAIDALAVPAEGLAFLGERFRGQQLRRFSVRLLVVEVDEADQVVEAVMLPATAASQVEPSPSSASDMRLWTKAGLPLRFSPIAMPTAIPSPCPSEPPVISIPGV